MTRAVLVAALLSVSLPSALLLAAGSASATPKAKAKGSTAAAAAHYAAGQKLYAAGRFAEALARFRAAQKLAPHQLTLFNIARCQENLGRSGEALKSYRAALRLEKDATRRADIEARIRRLATRRGRLFVTSAPPGARVIVDAGEPGEHTPLTPAVLKLPPGPHLLVLRKQGYGAHVRRVVVSAGDDRTLSVVLRRLADTKPPRCKPKTVVVQKPAPALARFDRLQMFVHVGFAQLVARAWGAQAGPSLHAGTTIERLLIGVHVHVMPVNRDVVNVDGTSGFATLSVAQLRVAWVLPFRSFYLTVGAAAGGYLDRVESGTGIGKAGESQNAGGFAWGLESSLEAMATSWLSLGVGLRAGMLHGRRLDESLRIDSRNHFPYLALWGGVTFHVGG